MTAYAGSVASTKSIAPVEIPCPEIFQPDFRQWQRIYRSIGLPSRGIPLVDPYGTPSTFGLFVSNDVTPQLIVRFLRDAGVIVEIDSDVEPLDLNVTNIGNRGRTPYIVRIPKNTEPTSHNPTGAIVGKAVNELPGNGRYLNLAEVLLREAFLFISGALLDAWHLQLCAGSRFFSGRSVPGIQWSANNRILTVCSYSLGERRDSCCIVPVVSEDSVQA